MVEKNFSFNPFNLFTACVVITLTSYGAAGIINFLFLRFSDVYSNFFGIRCRFTLFLCNEKFFISIVKMLFLLHVLCFGYANKHMLNFLWCGIIVIIANRRRRDGKWMNNEEINYWCKLCKIFNCCCIYQILSVIRGKPWTKKYLLSYVKCSR